MMFPVIYHDTIAIPNRQEFNIRVDSLSETQLVLRACKFVVGGQVYTLATDVSFDATNISLIAELWGTPDGKAQLLVYDRRILRFVDMASGQAMTQTYGSRLRPVVVHVSYHKNLITNQQYIGDYFLVNRLLKSQEVPADKILLSPSSSPPSPAVTEANVPALQKALAAFQATQTASAPPLKKWSELNATEQQEMMAKVAAQMGLVAKA
jgi:hypothetical protein